MRDTPVNGDFDYTTAFSRNLGLISPTEQLVLRNTRVALAGLGGVGGSHATTLARTGIGAFTIADPDLFEWANDNRQAGCMTSTIGQPKVDVLGNMIRSINPTAQVRSLHAIDDSTIADFLTEVDIVIDGLDFFAVQARRLLYREARLRGIPVVGAGPIGTSAIWQVYLPDSMPWEDFFAMSLAEDDLDRWALFYLGNAPAGLHLQSIDASSLRLSEKRGPSLALAVQMCSGVAAAELLKICLGRGPVYASPYHQQFDAYTQRFARTYLRWGLRGPIQRLRFTMLRRTIRAMVQATLGKPP